MLRCSLNKIMIIIVNNMSVESSQEVLNWGFSAIIQNGRTHYAIFLNCYQMD